MNTRRLERNIFAFRNLVQRLDDREVFLSSDDLLRSPPFHEVLDFHVEGWLIRIFFDGNEFDYFDSAVTPDGQELGFDDIGDWYPEKDWWPQ